MKTDTSDPRIRACGGAWPEIRADKLPVKDRSGEVLYYVSAAAALRMIDRGTVVPVGTKTVIRALQLPPEHDDSKIIPITAYVGQKYSHNHEAKENPEGVWTLKRIPTKIAPDFDTVLAEALGWRQLRKQSGQLVRHLSPAEAEELLASNLATIDRDNHRFWLVEVPKESGRRRKAA